MITITLSPGIILGLLSTALFISILLFLFVLSKLQQSRQRINELRRGQRNRKNCDFKNQIIEEAKK